MITTAEKIIRPCMQVHAVAYVEKKKKNFRGEKKKQRKLTQRIKQRAFHVKTVLRDYIWKKMICKN